MDFSYVQPQDPPELREWRQQCRAFVEAEIVPQMQEWEAAEQLSWDCYHKLADFGYIKLAYPERLGGTDDGSELATKRRDIAMQELARADMTSQLLLGIQTLYGALLDDGDAVHEEWLRSVIDGQHILAFCETEPGGGGDAAAISTTAVRDGDEWVLNGEKIYLTLVPGADWLLITALTRPDLGGKKGMSIFLVDSDTPGIDIYEIPVPEPRTWHPVGGARIDNVRIPLNRLLGEENQGFYHIKSKAWAKRLGGGGGSNLSRWREAVRAAADRELVDRPMLEHASIRDRLTNAFAYRELQRIAGLKGRWMLETGQRTTAAASMSILFTKVIGHQVNWTYLDILGDDTVDARSRSSKHYIASLGMRSTGGGVDVHRIIVGQELYGREYAVHRDYEPAPAESS